jgi:hypothetical protein
VCNFAVCNGVTPDLFQRRHRNVVYSLRLTGNTLLSHKYILYSITRLVLDGLGVSASGIVNHPMTDAIVNLLRSAGVLDALRATDQVSKHHRPACNIA